MRVDGPGITFEVPAGWEVEIDSGAGVAEDGVETVRTPRVHIANFPLPPVRGDFGSGAVEQMIDGDVLLCLLEESGAAAGSRLHGTLGVPALREHDFDPQSMQRPRRGQSGAQKFFSVDDRAFVLYAALGSHASRRSLVPQVNEILASIRLTA